MRVHPSPTGELNGSPFGRLQKGGLCLTVVVPISGAWLFKVFFRLWVFSKQISRDLRGLVEASAGPCGEGGQPIWLFPSVGDAIFRSMANYQRKKDVFVFRVFDLFRHDRADRTDRTDRTGRTGQTGQDSPLFVFFFSIYFSFFIFCFSLPFFALLSSCEFAVLFGSVFGVFTRYSFEKWVG